MSDAGIPIVSDVTFRVSADGAMIGVDFECKDGRVRTVAIPVGDLNKLLAGFVWAGDESANRRAPRPMAPPDRDALRDGARGVTDWRIVDAGGEQFLEVSVGAAFLCLRLARPS
ncbi:MAG: hypothetical protein NW200_10585 [Hyphomonadaceae bacterium]|nr:hypothetical protein [Hyphomonadaceae bacterium]